MFPLRIAIGVTLVVTIASASAQDNSTQMTDDLSSKSNQIETVNSSALGDTKIINGVDTKKLAKNIDDVMSDAIAKRETPGGVVLVMRDSVVFQKAYGNRSVEPTTETATLDTIYDMASLTKSIATATSIMQLVEQGKIRLVDHVDKFIPEWKNTPEEESRQKLLDKLEKAVDQGNIHLKGDLLEFSADAKSLQHQVAEMQKNDGLNPYSIRTTKDFFDFRPRDRESITIRHLLTHTSGLPSFVRYYEKYPEKHARKKIVADIAKLDLRGPVGGQFIYSDLGFITLGDIVERVSGLPLDQYSHKNVFEPLGMNDTGFNPPKDKWSRVAPTEWRVEKDPETSETRRAMIRGEVHDGNAWVQDGVSGHAGLFSTAGDVSIFIKMLMNGGSLNGVQILSPATIAAMMTDHADLPGGEPQRGLGWDLTSGYNGQKGDLFSTGFGHTGFTGTSVWVVPQEKLAVIILTNRVHPNGEGDSLPLRAKIANAVAGSLTELYNTKSR